MADGRNRAALEPVEVIVTHSSPSSPNQCLQFVHNNHATLESAQPIIMYHKDPTLLRATCKDHNLELTENKRRCTREIIRLGLPRQDPWRSLSADRYPSLQAILERFRLWCPRSAVRQLLAILPPPHQGYPQDLRTPVSLQIDSALLWSQILLQWKPPNLSLRFLP